MLAGHSLGRDKLRAHGWQPAEQEDAFVCVPPASTTDAPQYNNANDGELRQRGVGAPQHQALHISRTLSVLDAGVDAARLQYDLAMRYHLSDALSRNRKQENVWGRRGGGEFFFCIFFTFFFLFLFHLLQRNWRVPTICMSRTTRQPCSPGRARPASSPSRQTDAVPC